MAERHILRATVTRIDDDANPWVTIPDIGLDSEFGPCEVVCDRALAVMGARCIVGLVTGSSSDVVIIGVVAPGGIEPHTHHYADLVDPPGPADLSRYVLTTDARLSDTRTPKPHTHDTGDITTGTLGLARLPVASSGASSATQLVRADDSRLSDSRLLFRARAASTTNVALTGLQTMDGVSLAAGDVVLLKNQTNAQDNGLWVVGTGAWTRHPLFDTATEVAAQLVGVMSGTLSGGTQWATTFQSTSTLGTTGMGWVRVAPLGRGRFTATVFTVNDSTDTEIPLTTQVYLSGATKSATGEITMTRDGYIAVRGQVSWPTSAGSGARRVMHVYKNGVSMGDNTINQATAITWHQQVSAEFDVAAGDVIDATCWQNTGAAVTGVTGLFAFHEV